MQYEKKVKKLNLDKTEEGAQINVKNKQEEQVRPIEDGADETGACDDGESELI